MTASMTALDAPATLKSLKAIAAAQVARWPQYEQYFTHYRLARIKREIVTKLGLAFARDEVTIAVESPVFLWGTSAVGGDHVTAWSRRNAIDTSVHATDVEWL